MTETRKKPYRWWFRNRYVRRATLVIHFSLLFPVSVMVFVALAALEGARYHVSKYRELWEEYK